MSGAARSKWFKFLLVIGLTLFTAQCGDDSEVIVIEYDCPGLDGFAGGDYLLTVNVAEIADGCAEGAFNAFIPPGPYGPVTLPALGDLPQDITMELPFVGEITVRLSSDGTVLRVTVDDPIQVQDLVLNTPAGPVSFDVTARVSGTLCPVSATSVDAGFTVRVLSINPNPGGLIPTPCTIGVPATGELLL